MKTSVMKLISQEMDKIYKKQLKVKRKQKMLITIDSCLGLLKN